MIKAVIFDLGNVIVKVDREDMFKKFASTSKKSRQEIEDYYYKPWTRNAFENGRITSKEFYHKFTNYLEIDMRFNEFKKTYCDIFSLNNDVAQVIKKLKKKFRLILLSNTDELHFEYIKKKYKIVNIFDVHVLSYKVGHSKPNPLIFLDALKKAKAMPFSCLYFDDISIYVYSARLMGIRAFQYKNFEKLVEDLRNTGILSKTSKI